MAHYVLLGFKEVLDLLVLLKERLLFDCFLPHDPKGSK